MNVTRRPNGPYLIESSPHYSKRKACLFLRRTALLPVTVLCSAVAAYRYELLHMLDASEVYLGPGK
jgi:hypothetical protein